jgi:hypothetical protein
MFELQRERLAPLEDGLDNIRRSSVVIVVI